MGKRGCLIWILFFSEKLLILPKSIPPFHLIPCKPQLPHPWRPVRKLAPNRGQPGSSATGEPPICNRRWGVGCKMMLAFGVINWQVVRDHFQVAGPSNSDAPCHSMGSLVPRPVVVLPRGCAPSNVMVGRGWRIFRVISSGICEARGTMLLIPTRGCCHDH